MERRPYERMCYLARRLVALPYMQGSVSASQDQIDWVLTSYIVAAAIMTPPTGYLAGRFGIKRLFLVSIAGFTVASMLCGMAQSLVEIGVDTDHRRGWPHFLTALPGGAERRT